MDSGGLTCDDKLMPRFVQQRVTMAMVDVKNQLTKIICLSNFLNSRNVFTYKNSKMLILFLMKRYRSVSRVNGSRVSSAEPHSHSNIIYVSNETKASVILKYGRSENEVVCLSLTTTFEYEINISK